MEIKFITFTKRGDQITPSTGRVWELESRTPGNFARHSGCGGSVQIRWGIICSKGTYNVLTCSLCGLRIELNNMVVSTINDLIHEVVARTGLARETVAAQAMIHNLVLGKE